MSALLLPALAASSSGQSALYVDDVFSAYTYTGNGATQTINNGIDLAGKGGLVWGKGRSPAAAYNHRLQDTVNGVSTYLSSNTTTESTTQSTGVTAFNSNGYTLGSSPLMNQNNEPYASWTFRRAPKFFDVVTFTSNGSVQRIPHNLGVTPGLIIVKRVTSLQNWHVWHNSFAGNQEYLNLNLPNAKEGAGFDLWGTSQPTSIDFGYYDFGASGNQLVAYLFANDPSADGIIQCGSFTTDGGGNATVNLGWEPQYLMVKRTDSSSYGDWNIADSMRGMPATDNAVQRLLANSSAAEQTYGGPAQPTATGFKGIGVSGATYIYLAIRRPNKPPTSGTQVYNAIARTGTGAAATVTGVGFAPDLVNIKSRSTGSGGKFFDRLRGASCQIITSATGAEQSLANTVTSMDMDGISLGSDGGTAYVNTSGDHVINHFFRRAPGFMDVVCDTGTGVAHAIAHNLTKAPELIIRKSRSAATQWEVWHSALAATEKLVLNSNAAKAADATAWGSTLPTATQFTVGTGANVNANAATFVTYLFATLAGISKVGSYTGNGSSQTIDCGFSTGARFVLIKRTDSAGDWYVWDSVRGIVAANDPHLSLNTTAAEVITDDSIDPASVGFIVNQNTATNINVTGANYIFLAIA